MEQLGDFIFTKTDAGTEFRFNLNHISAYKELEKKVVIVTKGGTTQTLDLDFEEFDRFMRKILTNKIMKRN